MKKHLFSLFFIFLISSVFAVSASANAKRSYKGTDPDYTGPGTQTIYLHSDQGDQVITSVYPTTFCWEETSGYVGDKYYNPFYSYYGYIDVASGFNISPKKVIRWTNSNGDNYEVFCVNVYPSLNTDYTYSFTMADVIAGTWSKNDCIVWQINKNGSFYNYLRDTCGWNSTDNDKYTFNHYGYLNIQLISKNGAFGDFQGDNEFLYFTLNHYDANMVDSSVITTTYYSDFKYCLYSNIDSLTSDSVLRDPTTKTTMLEGSYFYHIGVPISYSSYTIDEESSSEGGDSDSANLVLSWSTCPECKSENISWGVKRTVGSLYYINYRCNDCGNEWLHTMNATEYEYLKAKSGLDSEYSDYFPDEEKTYTRDETLDGKGTINNIELPDGSISMDSLMSGVGSIFQSVYEILPSDVVTVLVFSLTALIIIGVAKVVF